MTFLKVNDKETQLASTSVQEGYEARQISAALLAAWDINPTTEVTTIVVDTLDRIIALADAGGAIPEPEPVDPEPNPDPEQPVDPDLPDPPDPADPVGAPTSVTIIEPGLVMGLSGYSTSGRPIMYTSGDGMGEILSMTWNTSGQLISCSIPGYSDFAMNYRVGEVLVPQCWFSGRNDWQDIITYPEVVVTSIYEQDVWSEGINWVPVEMYLIAGSVTGVANGSYHCPLEAMSGQNGIGAWVQITFTDGEATNTIPSYLHGGEGGAEWDEGYLTGETYKVDCSAIPGFVGYNSQPLVQIIGMTLSEDDEGGEGGDGEDDEEWYDDDD